MNMTQNLVIISIIFSDVVKSLNILGIFPYQGKSHFRVFAPYLQELAKRGHNVTVISYFPLNEPQDNYHDISLAGKAQVFENMLPLLKPSYIITALIALGLVYTSTDNCEKLLDDEDVQNLWKSQMKFDVVITEQFNSDCSLGLAYVLNAPVVGITSHVLLPYHYARFGISYNPSYVPFLFLDGDVKPTLFQRVERSIAHIYHEFIYKQLAQRLNQKTLAQYFDFLPSLDELARNIKIMLLYDNFVLTGFKNFPPYLIEVGGFHVTKPKQLPEELRKFIEESKHGVIYISFGSMLRAASIPKDKLLIILSALAELPQRVIWKWEAKSLPGKPKNIYVSKWLPQNDLLAHPNVLTFFSHCGQLGTTEAVYHGVPLIGLPLFGDQPINAAAIESSGFGVRIKLEDLSKANLLEKFKTVLNPEFRRNVKRLSQAWHDRPMSPMENAVYWTEYAARYPNITLTSPAAHVPLYQYLCLDVYFILFVLPLVIFSTSIYHYCIKRSRHSVEAKSKHEKKNI